MPAGPAAVAGAASPQLAARLVSLQGEIARRGARWTAGETPLSELTPEQMRGYLGLLETPTEIRASLPAFTAKVAPLALPSAFDWSDRNGASYVTAVRDQAGCGSCWAFATTAALEARSLISFRRHDEVFDLSEQTMVSCSGSGSCAGGYLGQSVSFLESTGLPSEQCYPYQATNGSCGAACAGWRQASYRIGSSLAVARTVADLKAALIEHGPLPVGMSVFSDFQSYSGGVYSHASGGYLGGHAVALVGYDDASSCFIVKNSWGDGWGEEGFFRIAYAEVAGATAFGRDALAYGPAISPFDPADLGEAVDAPGLAWSTGLAGNWFRQMAASFHGGDAAQSGRAGRGEASWIQAEIEGPATVEYDALASRGDYGALSLKVDGEQVEELRYGTAGWQHRVVPLGDGLHRLRWHSQAWYGEPEPVWLDRVVVGPPGEQLTPAGTPAGLSGPGAVGTLYRFESAGAASTGGHLIQYRFDWGDGTRSSWSGSPAAVHAWSLPGTYQIKAQARCASHVSLRTPWSAPLAVAIDPPPPIPLARALDAPGLEFETGGDAPWFSQRATTHSGGSAAQSGQVGDFYGNGVSWIRTTITGPGGLRFLWRSSAPWDSGVAVRVGDDPYQSVSISGTTPWRQELLVLGAGTRTVTWTYDQESLDPLTVNGAWLDEVEFLPSYEALSPLGDITGRESVTAGLPFTYSVAAVASNQGHPVEYRFDWGDGTASAWSPEPSAAHAFEGEFNRSVTAQARCAAHHDVVAESTDSVWVRVSPVETIPAPVISAGPPQVWEADVAWYTASPTETGARSRQYRFDWGDGSISAWTYWTTGSTQMSYRWLAAGLYAVKVQSRCPDHPEMESPWSAGFAVEVAAMPRHPLGAALDANGLVWTTGGDAPWFGQDVVAYSGGLSARSGAIGDGQVSWLQTTVSGPGRALFAWRVWSAYGDTLAVYLDGVRQSYPREGDVPWEVVSLPLAAGAHTLRWEYRKNDGGTDRGDCAWLDEVVVTSSSETVGTPGYPAGSSPVQVGTPAAFTLPAATSSLGHAVEHRFDWGDGSFSPWGAGTAASHAWAAAGQYRVRGQARCAEHPAVVSGWSSYNYVVVREPEETVTTPAAPTGPTEVVDGVLATYTAGTATTSAGHPVEYSFSWCDGLWYSIWSASPSAAHAWPLPRTCSVKAIARCALHDSAESTWSAPLVVTIATSEPISTPAVAGPATAVAKVATAFSALGAASSLGHPLRYLFTWGDGSTTGYAASPEAEHAWNAPGTFNVTVKAMCATDQHTSEVSAVFPVTVSWPEETVTAPPAPAGPEQVWRAKSAAFTAVGAATSLGHAVQHRYDWGDGTLSSWSDSPSASHAWAAAGEYAVRVKARCKTDYGNESGWSGPAAVTVAVPPETISTPTKPVGPGYTVYLGDTVPYSSGGAVSSLGHAVEYRLCFGRTDCTEWSDLPLATHAWGAETFRTVSAQARCVAHPGMESDLSPELFASISQETPAILGAPSGPGVLRAGATAAFVAGDADPDLGHGRELSFDWGDGAVSGWRGDASRTHAWDAPGTYAVRVRQRCAKHPTAESSWSQPFAVLVVAPNQLAAVVDAPTLAIETGGDAAWFGQVADVVAGDSAARSGAVGDNQFSWMRTSVAGPGELAFSWKVSSDAGDALVLYLDGKEEARISGAVAWQRRTVALGAGRHTVLWLYRKDGAGAGGADCGKVDQLSLVTEAETVTKPDAPSGPGEGVTETRYAYQAAGASSDKGHEVEYRFDWGDGELSAWSADPSAGHAWAVPGTYRVVAQARCGGEPANVSAFSEPTTVQILLLVENVAAPPAPSGSSVAVAGLAAPFTTGGADSDLGHSLEYRFDWGDGSLSTWSAETRGDHPWSDSGVFEVRAQARCAAHRSAESPWSGALLVAVALPPEAVAPPPAPTGPAGAKTGSVVACAIGGGSSNLGHVLEHRVDWGDGVVSDWGAATGGAHSWPAAGTYLVRAQARCATDRGVESAWSEPLAVSVSDHHDLGEAVDNTALVWETGGDAPWAAVALKGAADGDAAGSSALAPLRSSWVETTVDGPTSLYFLWRTASEAGKDRLVFRLDGVEQGRISGKTPWLFRSARLGEGNHRVQWRFTRGSPLATGSHRAWLDLLVEDPRDLAGVIKVLKPAGGETWARGQAVTLRWSRTGVIGPAVAVQLLARTPGGAWTARTLAPAVPDTGFWPWKVPATLIPGVRYRIRVVSCAGPAITATSKGSFTVR